MRDKQMEASLEWAIEITKQYQRALEATIEHNIEDSNPFVQETIKEIQKELDTIIGHRDNLVKFLGHEQKRIASRILRGDAMKALPDYSERLREFNQQINPKDAPHIIAEMRRRYKEVRQ